MATGMMRRMAAAGALVAGLCEWPSPEAVAQGLGGAGTVQGIGARIRPAA